MRIYDGSPRQDFEEVFRSIGAFLDTRGTRDVLLLEVPDGFVVQGWSPPTRPAESGRIGGYDVQETLTFSTTTSPSSWRRRRHGAGRAQGAGQEAGTHEQALRVIGRWMDEQKPKDVFLFEQEGAYVIRLLMGGQAGVHHALFEFTKDDIDDMVARGPSLRIPEGSPAGSPAGSPVQ
jgi:hypothetical protein